MKKYVKILRILLSVLFEEFCFPEIHLHVMNHYTFETVEH